MAAGPRIALFGHDTFGLGHLRRNLTIAHQLARDIPDARFLGLTGSSQAHAFRLPPRFDFVKIPTATKGPDGAYISQSLDLSLAELTEMRSRLIAEALVSFRPDLVLVDHAPAGMEGELLMPLNRLREANPHVAIALGLRDVIDEPTRVRQDWERLGLFDWMEDIYDRVLIYGAAGVGPSPEEYGLSPRLNGRVRFMHYVHRTNTSNPNAVRPTSAPVRSEPLVVATIGGGGDGDRILHGLLDAVRSNPSFPARIVIVTGPLMAVEAAAEIRACARPLPRVQVINFDPDLPNLLMAANAIVSMAGYNSTVEILASGVPAVFVPRVFPRREQWIRAKAMEDLGLCRVLHPDHATPERLLEAVAAALAEGPRSESLPFQLDGVKNVSLELRSLLEDRVAGARSGHVA